jgi:hypothetical protein
MATYEQDQNDTKDRTRTRWNRPTRTQHGCRSWRPYYSVEAKDTRQLKWLESWKPSSELWWSFSGSLSTRRRSGPQWWEWGAAICNVLGSWTRLHGYWRRRAGCGPGFLQPVSRMCRVRCFEDHGAATFPMSSICHEAPTRQRTCICLGLLSSIVL